MRLASIKTSILALAVFSGPFLVPVALFDTDGNAVTNQTALGDIRHADFSSLEVPVASVNSLLAWDKALNQILKGIPPEPPVDSESLAEAAGVTPTAITTIGDVVTALNNKNAGFNPNTRTIEEIIEAL